MLVQDKSVLTDKHVQSTDTRLYGYMDIWVPGFLVIRKQLPVSTPIRKRREVYVY